MILFWSMNVMRIPNTIKVNEIYNIRPLNFGKESDTQRSERIAKLTEIQDAEIGTLIK